MGFAVYKDTPITYNYINCRWVCEYVLSNCEYELCKKPVRITYDMQIQEKITKKLYGKCESMRLIWKKVVLLVLLIFIYCIHRFVFILIFAYIFSCCYRDLWWQWIINQINNWFQSALSFENPRGGGRGYNLFRLEVEV